MKALFIIFLSLTSSAVIGQELNARVVVDYTQVQIADPSIFDDMEKDFADFVNGRKWTDDQFENHERINCNFLITITGAPSVGVFNATVQIVSSRPVYGTEYESVLLNFADRDWAFNYIPSRPINYNENSFTDNISSLLAFYAYVIIGMDYDSFGELAGTKHYQQASLIVNNAQQSNYPGWQQFGSNRNRFWLIENLQSSTLEPLRSALYSYHRHGMDIMRDKPDQARNKIAEALQVIQKANRSRPRAVLTISFMDSKAVELASIFSSGSPTVRKKAYAILTQIDPSKTDMFKPMIE